MPYEETGIYRARTKTTFELEVVKHRGVTSRQNMPTITAHIANNRFPVFLPEYLAKILSLRFAVYLKRQKRKGAASRTGTMTG